MGCSDDALARPIIGITDTFSSDNPCHRNVPDIIAALERGILSAGGLPMRFPVVSIHESFGGRKFKGPHPGPAQAAGRIQGG
jgi:dihydroxy-acid dehydratase